jgi:hypothetical protein
MEGIMAMKTTEHQTPGDRVIATVSADESLGELFQFEYICRTVTSAPKDHVHISRESGSRFWKERSTAGQADKSASCVRVKEW